MAKAKPSLTDQMKISASGWKENSLVRLFFYFLLAVICYFSLSSHVLLQTFELNVGEVSTRDIYSPWEFEDEAATAKAEQEASAQVEDVFTTLNMRNMDMLSDIFAKFKSLNADEMVSNEDKVEVYRLFFSQEFRELLRRPITNNRELTPSLAEEIEAQLSQQQYRIPEEVYFKLPQLNAEQIQSMQITARDIVRSLMADRITDVSQIRTRVAEMVLASNLDDRVSRELVQEIIRFVLTPNTFYDEESTQEARLEAAESVEPVVIEKNDLIVSSGQTITEEKYELLSELGMLKEGKNFRPQFGLMMMVALLVFLLSIFVRRSGHAIQKNNALLFMLVLILTLTMVSIKIIAIGHSADYPYIGYLAPIAMGSMLITVLLEIRIAFISTVLFAIMGSMILNVHDSAFVFDFRYGFVFTVVGIVSIFAINKASQRSTILKAGGLVSVFASLSHLAIALIVDDIVASELALAIAYCVGSGLLTAILVIGLLPFFEVAFGILSPMKLVELSNPNHPLLRKLLTETPGTYHHSVMVGNLSEAAAESIGANGLLCRVGSFYHDMGKTKRPHYFIENQHNMDNPHDQIKPELSKEIIIAHARDGANMLRNHKMPKAICDIAEQHHGTTLLKYFYHKAMKQQEEDGQEAVIPEEDYRYPGPKAQTKEAAIVGIADCVEAAVRSLKHPTVQQIGTMVDNIIRSRLDDNQYNECDITLKELEKVAKSLKETLLGIFHSRIEYPELPQKQESGR